MILKPFMLRRIKKDVENELSDKVGERAFFSETSFLSRAAVELEVILSFQMTKSVFTILKFWCYDWTKYYNPASQVYVTIFNLKKCNIIFGQCHVALLLSSPV